MKILDHQPWRGTFPLAPFFQKFYRLKSAKGKKRVFMLTDFRASFYTVSVTYTWIGYILDRVDNDLYNCLVFFDILERARPRSVSADQLPQFDAHLTTIDVMSLIIFCNILMDDIARFLGFLFWGESKPRTGSFNDLKKTIQNFDGRGMQQLKNIIQNANWFDDLKELRDKPIVHKGEREPSAIKKGQEAGVWLRYVEKGRIKERFCSNRTIDNLCNNIYGFLADLNNHLCAIFDLLPIEVNQIPR